MANQLELITSTSPTGLLDDVVRTVTSGSESGWCIVAPRTYLAREITSAIIKHTGTDAWVDTRVMTVDELVAHYARKLDGRPALTPLQVRQILHAVVLDLHNDTGGQVFPGQVVENRVSEATLRSLSRLFSELEPFGWSGDALKEQLEQGPQSESTLNRAQMVTEVYREYLRRIGASGHMGPQGQAVRASDLASKLPPPEGVKRFLFVGLDTSGLKDVGVRTAYALARNKQVDVVKMALLLPEHLDIEHTAWEVHGNTHLYEFWAEDWSERTHIPSQPRIEGLPEDLQAVAYDPFAYRLDPVESTGAVRAIRVPDTQLEVSWVAGDIKRRIVDEGTPPDSIAVIARDMDGRAEDLEEALQELGVPVVSSRQRRIENVPAVRALLALFRLPAHQWRVPDVVAVAESPYLATELNPTLLARIGGSGTTPADDEEWSRRVQAFRRESALRQSQGDFRGGDLPAEHADMAAGLETHFENFRSQVQTTIGHEPKRPKEWVETLVATIEAWSIQDQIYRTSKLVDRGQRGRLARADLDGLNTLLRSANDWLRGREIAHGRPSDGEEDATTPPETVELLDARTWYQELASMASEAKIRESTFPRQAVHLLLPAQASLRSWDVVYIIGLVDSVFPMHSEPTDHTLSDDERRALYLPTQEQRSARERLLFHISAATARQQLILVAPAADDRGKALVTSPFVTCLPLRIRDLAIEQVTARDMVPQVEADVLRPGDVHVLATERYREEIRTGNGGDVSDELLKLWLHSPTGQRAVQGWGVERMRATLDRRLATAGDLPVRIPRGEFAALFDPAEVPDGTVDESAAFSPSEISTYERCHFRVYATRLLGLGRAPDHEDDHDEAAAFGTLQHRILEKLYSELMTDGSLPPTSPGVLQHAMDRLDVIADREVRDFMASADERLWALDLDFVLDVLRDFVRRDLKRMIDAYTNPESQEIRTKIVALEERVGPVDAEHEDVRFRIRGVIDRVEAIDDERVDPNAQGWLILKDYKSTRNQNWMPKPDLFLKGKNIQLPLYSHTAAEHFDTGVFGFGELRTSQAVDPKPLAVRQAVPDGAGGLQLVQVDGYGPNPVRESEEKAIEAAATQVRRMRAGQFAPQPGRQCFGCPIKALCRSALIADPGRMRNRAQMPLAVDVARFDAAEKAVQAIQAKSAKSGKV